MPGSSLDLIETRKDLSLRWGWRRLLKFALRKLGRLRRPGRGRFSLKPEPARNFIFPFQGGKALSSVTEQFFFLFEVISVSKHVKAIQRDVSETGTENVRTTFLLSSGWFSNVFIRWKGRIFTIL